MTRRIHRTALLAGLAAMAVPAGALGSVGLSPLRFFAPASPFQDLLPDTTSAAIDSHGDAVVGELVRSASGRLATPTVRTRTGARGPWSATIRLAKPTADTSEPKVAIGERGDAVAAFRRSGGYVAARRLATGWRLRPIGAPAPATDDATAVAVLPSGATRFVQALPDPGCDPAATPCMWTVAVFDQAGPESPWARAAGTLRAGPAQALSPALGRRGDMLVAWATPGDSSTVIASRRLVSDADFEPAGPVAPPGIRGPVHTAVGGSGDTVVGWVRPDASGVGTTFTGSVEVALHGAASPAWASPETVAPAGTPNPDLALAIDAAANVAASWTSLQGAPGAAVTLRASIRAAATSQWAPPAVLAAVSGDGASIDDPVVLIENARAFVHLTTHLGPGASAPALAVGGPGGGWTVRRLTGNAQPGGGPDPVDAVAAQAPDGRLLLAASGLQIRNFDGAATLAPARATAVTVRVAGARATVGFRLTAAARVFVQRASGPALRRVGEYPSLRLAAGPHVVPLGPLAAGRYRVTVGACGASRGCTTSRSVTFRIR
jgi:hypothetical protein